MKRPEFAKVSPIRLQEKIKNARLKLIQEKLKRIQKPNPIAVYFEGVRRGPLAAI